MRHFIFLMLLILLVFNGSAVASDVSGEDDSFPVYISSDAMVSDQASGYIEFAGNVVLKREADVIYADTMKIFLKENTKKTSAANPEDKPQKMKQTIQKIEATGNVRYESGDRKAFADKAVYTTEDQILILTGVSPKVITGDSYVTGQKITLYRTENRVDVKGGEGQRVEAFFNPKDKKKIE